MAIGKIEFDLNEPDEQKGFLRAAKSTDMAIVLWDITHNDTLCKKDTERVFELLSNYGLDIEKLID